MIVDSPNEMTSRPSPTIERTKPATATPLSGTGCGGGPHVWGWPYPGGAGG
jgi:hypothetical protein